MLLTSTNDLGRFNRCIALIALFCVASLSIVQGRLTGKVEAATK